MIRQGTQAGRRLAALLTVLMTALLLVMSAAGLTLFDRQTAFAEDELQGSPAEGSRIVIPVSLQFIGNSLPTESFTVQLTDLGSGSVTTGSVTLSAGTPTGKIELAPGDLQPGVHDFELRQLAGKHAGIRYSDEVYRYRIEVDGDGGVRQYAVDPEDPSDKPEEVSFTNHYQRSGPDEVLGDPPVRVQKDISGRKPPEVERFVFLMRPEYPDYPLPDVEAEGSGVIKDGVAEVYLDGEGEVEFGNIRFTQEGTYRYFVSEKDTAVEAYDYDDARFTVVYEVSRDREDRLVCERSILGKDGKPASQCDFDNIYDPNPVSRKLQRAIKTGDPFVMWPLTLLCASSLVSITLLWDRRKRRKHMRTEARHGC